jgi:hypothetical protein
MQVKERTAKNEPRTSDLLVEEDQRNIEPSRKKEACINGAGGYSVQE